MLVMNTVVSTGSVKAAWILATRRAPDSTACRPHSRPAPRTRIGIPRFLHPDSLPGVRQMIAALDLTTDRLIYRIRDRKICDNFSPHKHPEVRNWCATNRLDLMFLFTYASWLNWIEAEFTAVRYVALNGTDHRTRTEQNTALGADIRWRNQREDASGDAVEATGRATASADGCHGMRSPGLQKERQCVVPPRGQATVAEEFDAKFGCGSIGVNGGMRASIAAAASRQRSSLKRGPMTCTACGRPSVFPVGIATAGSPSRLTATANRIVAGKSDSQTGSRSHPSTNAGCVRIGASTRGVRPN